MAKWLIISMLVLCAGVVQAKHPESGPGPATNIGQAPDTIRLEHLRLFSPTDKGTTARFKLVNESADPLYIPGESGMSGLVMLRPTRGRATFSTYFRAEGAKGDAWQKVAEVTADDKAGTGQLVNPGRSIFLDVLMPNAPDGLAGDLLVQVVIVQEGDELYVNSTPFPLEWTDAE